MRTAPLALLALGLAAMPAHAFHRQSPPVTPLTMAGDNALTRVPPIGNKLVVSLASGGGRNLFRFAHGDSTLVQLTTGNGLNDHPACNVGASIVVWDAQCDVLCPEGGRQLMILAGTAPVQQLVHDPTGTSTNPAVNGRGSHVLFESNANFAGTNGLGARQIFHRTSDGSITQVSRGGGTSRNPTISRSGRLMAFDSTTDPATNADTGVSQIWVATFGYPAAPITDGASPSSNPTLSSDGRLVAFESTADLAGNGANTGVSQIFTYEPRTNAYHRLTNQAGGCHGATVDGSPRDSRVAFTCSGKAYIHFVRANSRFIVPMLDDGDTSQAGAELGAHFVMVASTADPEHGGPRRGTSPTCRTWSSCP